MVETYRGRTLVKSAYQKIYFLISQPKHNYVVGTQNTGGKPRNYHQIVLT